MAVNLNDAEYFADTIMSRVEQLINERDILRRELARKSDGTLEHDRAFVRAYQNNVVDNAAASEKIARLEHMLMIG
ncbi:MAG: hypothetical protein IJG51_01815 [Synergistaceae bacterium]|nr:hypothetical protein [Synergistaceae bacterium]MBQ3397604.1 hypothetical protein [Synergistaceae bacterium]MBQ3757948.1 hypothetical protein [Synergistaceae bacterium]MBQ4402412.1 hypothetical protein [Synergistaceae bacterium]MBQ6115429.1 hypothetical protein [Synergistaceae bacterium]